jgi:hypothetical protein
MKRRNDLSHLHDGAEAPSHQGHTCTALSAEGVQCRCLTVRGARTVPGSAVECREKAGVGAATEAISPKAEKFWHSRLLRGVRSQ